MLGPATYGGATCAFSLAVPDVDAWYAPGRGQRGDERPGADRRVLRPGGLGHRPVRASVEPHRRTARPASRRGRRGGPRAATRWSGRTRRSPSGIDGRPRRPPDQALRARRPVLLHDPRCPTWPRPRRSSAPCSAGASTTRPAVTWQHRRAARRHPSADTPDGAELWLVVADIHAAVAKVRALGGTAERAGAVRLRLGRGVHRRPGHHVQPQRPRGQVQPLTLVPSPNANVSRPRPDWFRSGRDTSVVQIVG